MAWGSPGVFRQPSSALPPRDRSRRTRHASHGPRPGPLLMAALRRRLDPLPRPRGAGGDHIPEPVAEPQRGGAMNSREAVFASIRRSLAVSGDEAPRRFRSKRDLRKRQPASSPSAGKGDPPARLATFKAEAERAQASLAEVADWTDAPAEIARFLRENNCPATVRMGADPRLAAMPWSATTLEILHGASDGRDPTRFRRPSPELQRPARWRSSPAPTTRPPSIFCPTATSWC